MGPKGSSQLDTFRPEIVKRMIEDGEWDKIMSVLKSRLNESGWLDDTTDTAKEKARNQNPPKFQALYDELRGSAPTTIPLSVKKDIMNMIRRYLEEQVVQG